MVESAESIDGVRVAVSTSEDLKSQIWNIVGYM